MREDMTSIVFVAHDPSAKNHTHPLYHHALQQNYEKTSFVDLSTLTLASYSKESMSLIDKNTILVTGCSTNSWEFHIIEKAKQLGAITIMIAELGFCSHEAIRFQGLTFETAPHLILTTNIMASKMFQERLDQLGVATSDTLVEVGGSVHMEALVAARALATPLLSREVYTPCVCQYEGTLVDGTVFDSTYDRGNSATFAPNQVIPAWKEALQLMRAGDKWKLFVPSELGYGNRGAGKLIKPNAALIFDLDVVEIKHGTTQHWYSTLPLIGPMTAPIFENGSFTYGHIVLFVGLMYYMTSKKDATGGRKVAARHILVKELALATSLKEQLLSNATTFEKVASEHSICPSKKQGGFLGEFSAGQMVPQFDQVVWSAKIGEMAGPVQTQFGYHLIEVTRRDPPVVLAPSDKVLEVEYKPGKFNNQSDGIKSESTKKKE